MATDLQTLVNAIPKAEDGHVITSDYHNSLRAALLAMLDNLGAIKGGAVVQTITPTFFTNKDRSAWVVLNGVAAATDQAKTTSGFLALGLPDGARIQRL